MHAHTGRPARISGTHTPCVNSGPGAPFSERKVFCVLLGLLVLAAAVGRALPGRRPSHPSGVVVTLESYSAPKPPGTAWHPSLAAEAHTVVCAMRYILDWAEPLPVPVGSTNAVA